MSEANLTRDVIFHLTDEEIQERGRLLALAYQDIEATKTKAKQIAGEFSRKVKTTEERVSALADAVATRQEKRPVLCEERVNARLYRVDTVRLDNGEVVDTRPMTDEELADAQQGQLFTDQERRRNAPTDDPNGPADTGSLPDHETFDPTRGPDQRIACPGPEGGEGCVEAECIRCAGAGFIPAPVDADGDPEPGTEITNPEGVAASIPSEAKGGRGNRKGGKGATAGATH